MQSLRLPADGSVCWVQRASTHLRTQAWKEAASVGNRAPPHGGGGSGGVFPLRATTTAADSRCSRHRSAGGDDGTTLLRSVISDEDGGNPANIAASGASNQIQRDAGAAWKHRTKKFRHRCRCVNLPHPTGCRSSPADGQRRSSGPRRAPKIAPSPDRSAARGTDGPESSDRRRGRP
jgi:hypothetical protein